MVYYMRKLLILSLLVISSSLNVFSEAILSDTIYIKGTRDTIDASSSLYILYDTKGDLSIDQVASGSAGSEFIRSTRINREAKACWVRLKMKNQTKNIKYYIQITPHVEFALYLQTKTGFIKKVHGSDVSLFQKDNIIDHSLILLDISNDSTETVYIRTDLEQISVIRENEVSVNIISSEESYPKLIFQSAETAFILGILIVMAIYYFILFFFVKDKAFIYYAASLFCLGVFQLSSFSVLNHRIGSLSALGGMYSFMNFTKHYVKAPDFFPAWNKFFNYFRLLYIPLLIIEFTPYYGLSKWSDNIIFLATLILQVIFALSALKTTRQAKFYVYIICFFIALMMLMIMSKNYLNIIPFDNYFINRGPFYGAVIQMVFFSIVLGTGIDSMREELNKKKIETANFEKQKVIDIQKITEKKNEELSLMNQTIHDQNIELERKNAELLYLSAVASETENGIAIINKDGHIEWTNQRFQASHQLGKQIQSVPLNTVYSLANLPKILHECKVQQKAYTFEYNVSSAGIAATWLLITLSPLIRNEQLINYIAIESDITKIKAYEEELRRAKERAEESDRLKSSFLANISHEIRTPMNAILGFSEMLINTTQEDKKLRFSSIIRNSGNDLMTIINDIIDISLIESGQIKVFKKALDLNEMLDEIKERYNRVLIDKNKPGIELRILYEKPGKVLVFTDPIRLKQIMDNLINNAIKFTSMGHIEIGYNIFRNNVLLFVKDTGIGIKKEDQQKVFNRFYKVENSGNNLYGGLGIGLTISENLVKLLSGNLYLTSELNKGTTVSIELENAIISEVPDAQKAEIDQTLWQGKRILIAEDEELAYALVFEMLAHTGIKVDRAKNGKEVIYQCSKNTYDSILMDIRMPVMDGIDAIKQIRNSVKAPIIALTAYTFNNDRSMLLNIGFDNYITKPIDGKELMKVLAKYLNKIAI